MSQTHSLKHASVHFNRPFAMALYTGTMLRLLLRSPKTAVHASRIDILFRNTRHIDLPTSTMEDLELADVGGDETLRAPPMTWATEQLWGAHLFQLRFTGGVGYVVAGGAAYIEDSGERWEPSKFDVDL